MRGGANLCAGVTIGLPAKLRLLLRVVQAEAGFIAAVGRGGDRAAGQGIGAARLGLGVGRGGFAAGQAGRLDQAEQAAALQVGAHHGSQRSRYAGFAIEVGDGDRNAVGTGAGDLDSELGAARQRRQQQRGHEHGTEFHREIIT